MKKFKDDVVLTKVLTEITCDVCGKTFDPEKDWEEAQEFTFIAFRAGYGSIFGDDSDIECDVCQHCVAKLLGDFLRINGLTKAERSKE